MDFALDKTEDTNYCILFVAMSESKKTSPNEDKIEANNNERNSAAQKVDKLITLERKISETKDSTSEANNKNNINKKSKTCCIL